MKIKMLMLVFLTLLLTFITVGCKNSIESIEPVEIRFWVPFQNINTGTQVDEWIKTYQNAVANFNKANPFITVNLEFNTTDNYNLDDSIKLLESDSPPDIIPIPPMQRFITEKKKLLVDLYQLQKSTGSDSIDINQRILDSVTIDGKLPILPYSARPQAILYNKEMFDEANVPYPLNNWTWEQFRTTSIQLKHPLGDPILDYIPQVFDKLLASMGKGVLSPDGQTSVGYLDSPEAVQALQWLNAYYLDNKKTEPINQDPFGHYSQFDGHLNPMLIDYYGNIYSTFMRDKKNKLGVVSMPYFAAGKRVSSVVLDGFGISSKSKHPKAAWNFIEYLTLQANEDSVKLSEQFITTSKSVSEASGQDKDSTKSVYIDEMNYVTTPSSDVNRLLDKAWEGELTTEFQELITVKDTEIAGKLHQLAVKLDQALQLLKSSDENAVKSAK